MKSGYLIVNNFIRAKKFYDIYRMLVASALELDVDLKIVKTGSMIFETGGLETAKLPDFALFWDKDVALCRRIERYIPVFNDAEAILFCDNKILTAVALETHGVPTPKTVLAPKAFEGVWYTDDAFLRRAIKKLGLPVVIKEAYGSFGKQVHLAKTFEEVKAIVEEIDYKEYLLQEYVAESYGRDIRVNVVGDRVICAMARENANDFRSNISSGGKARPIEITPEQAEVAIAACRAVGADFAGVDMFFGEPKICEVNSCPHFKSTYEYTGIDISKDIIRHVLKKL